MKERAATPYAIYYLQTDVSGEIEEGRGGLYVPLPVPNPQFISISWHLNSIPSS